MGRIRRQKSNGSTYVDFRSYISVLYKHKIPSINDKRIIREIVTSEM